MARLVKVRLSGDAVDVDAMVDRLGEVLDVADASRPYDNRHDDGVRRYLTVIVTDPGGEAASP